MPVTITRAVLKESIPVDDQAHEVTLSGFVRFLHVESQHSVDSVEVWFEADANSEDATKTFRVFGTGHPIPDGWSHVGSTVIREWGLVWHLYEKGDV